MRQFRWQFAWVLWLLALPTGLWAAPIVIGVDLGLSDRQPLVARDIQRALLDHARVVNRSGGLASGRALRFEFLDNRGIGDRSLEHLHRLQARKDVVAIIGGREAAALEGRLFYATKPLLIAWGIAEQTITALPAQQAGPRDVAANEHERHSFRVVPPMVEQMSIITQHMLTQGQSAIALVLSAEAEGRLCQDAISQQLLDLPSLRLAVAERLPIVAVDYALLLQSIRDSTAQTLIWCARGEQLAEFLGHLALRPGELAKGRGIATIYPVSTASDTLAKLSAPPAVPLQIKLMQSSFLATEAVGADVYGQTRALAMLLTQAIGEAASLSPQDLSAALRARMTLTWQVQLTDYPLAHQGSNR